jgi:ADP-heptose:LPS heptosyltransferase
MEDQKFVIVHMEGGLGKHVVGTAVVEGVKKAYPERKLILVCGYPEVFLGNPYVDRVYRLGHTPYFFEDYVKDKDSIILKHDPYASTDHIHQKRHLIESWFDVFNLSYEGESPQIFSNYRYAEIVVDAFAKKTNKPIMLLHTNGGPYDVNGSYNERNIKSWSRDMPTPIIDALVKQYKNNYHILQVCKSKDLAHPEVQSITEPLNNLELLNLVRIAQKRVLIDSSLQHAAAAFKLPSVVLWNGTNPNVFGYELHKNILPTKGVIEGYSTISSYLYEYELWGDPVQCPYSTNDIYDFEEIKKAIDETN